MNPELSLLIIGGIAKFCLRFTLAFGMCLILNRLVTKASWRFLLWAAFLYGSAVYWLCLACSLVAVPRSSGGSLAPLPSGKPGGSLQAPWAAAWQVPQGWASSLKIGLASLAVMYCLVLLYIALTHANKLRRLQWVMGFAIEPPDDMTDRVAKLAANLSIRPPRMQVLSGTFSPATFGWLRPIIVLPTLCLDQEDADLDDILLHELHHVRRKDAFWNTLGVAARGLLCFHPGAWYAMAQMRIDRELACDLAVVSHSPARKRDYAESLLRFARLNMAPEPANWGIDFAAPADNLTVRVRSILSEATQVNAWLLWLRATAALATLAVFAGVAPSLAILLVYAHPLTQPTTPAAAMAQPGALQAGRVARKFRGHMVQEHADKPSSGAPVDTGTAGMVMEAQATVADEHPTPDSGPGPHLQRRSGARSAGTKSQTIPLVDDGDSEQAAKHGEASQALQQSATIAAAIWKRAGELDHH